MYFIKIWGKNWYVSMNKILNIASYAKELVNWGKTQLLLP